MNNAIVGLIVLWLINLTGLITLHINIITCLLVFGDLFAVTGFFLTYGPIDYFRNLLVNTAMKTMEHQYLAYVFYNEDMVNEIMSKNYFIEINDEVNLDDIIINTKE